MSRFILSAAFLALGSGLILGSLDLALCGGSLLAIWNAESRVRQ
jgi:hypothetical protein